MEFSQYRKLGGKKKTMKIKSWSHEATQWCGSAPAFYLVSPTAQQQKHKKKAWWDRDIAPWNWA